MSESVRVNTGQAMNPVGMVLGTREPDKERRLEASQRLIEECETVEVLQEYIEYIADNLTEHLHANGYELEAFPNPARQGSFRGPLSEHFIDEVSYSCRVGIDFPIDIGEVPHYNSRTIVREVMEGNTPQRREVEKFGRYVDEGIRGMKSYDDITVSPRNVCPVVWAEY